MRLTRKTVAALGLSGALTVMGGVLASAAVLNLPILGFGEAANQAAAPPRVIHRTVYDDHYVTANTAPKAEAPAAGSPAPKAAPGAPATTTVPTAGTAAPAGAPASVAATAPAAPAGTAPAGAPAFVGATAPAAPAAPAGTAPAAPATTQPEVTPPPPSGRPPAPAGCREPEWDSEHQAWHCSNGESGDE